jgi:hypothetical protein
VRLISRVVAGWNVRMVVAGNRRSRFFADSQFGGKTAALKAAEVYRDSIVASRKTHVTRPRPLRVVRNSTSCYQIRIPRPGGGTTTTEFSIDRHGSRQAKQMALKAFANAAAGTV